MQNNFGFSYSAASCSISDQTPQKTAIATPVADIYSGAKKATSLIDDMRQFNELYPRVGRREGNFVIDCIDSVSCASCLFFPESELLKDFNCGVLEDINTAWKSRKIALGEISNIRKDISLIDAETIEAKGKLSSLVEKLEHNTSKLNKLAQSSKNAQVPVVPPTVENLVKSLNKVVLDLTKKYKGLCIMHNNLQREVLSKEIRLGEMKHKVIRISQSALKPNLPIFEERLRFDEISISTAKAQLQIMDYNVVSSRKELKEAKKDLYIAKKELNDVNMIARQDLINARMDAKQHLLNARKELQRGQDRLEAKIVRLAAEAKELKAIIERKQSMVAAYESTIIKKAQDFEETILVDAAKDEHFITQVLKHIDDLGKIDNETLKGRFFNEGTSTILPHLCENCFQCGLKLQDNFSVRFNGGKLVESFFSSALKNMRLENFEPSLYKTKLPLTPFSTMDCGKSHMMLALVSYLMSRGEKVIYFANAASMLVPTFWGERLLLLIEQEKKRPTPDTIFINRVKSILNKSRYMPIAELLRGLQGLRGKVYLCVEQFETLKQMGREELLVKDFVNSFGHRAVLALSDQGHSSELLNLDTVDHRQLNEEPAKRKREDDGIPQSRLNRRRSV